MNSAEALAKYAEWAASKQMEGPGFKNDNKILYGPLRFGGRIVIYDKYDLESYLEDGEGEGSMFVDPAVRTRKLLEHFTAEWAADGLAERPETELDLPRLVSLSWATRAAVVADWRQEVGGGWGGAGAALVQLGLDGCEEELISEVSGVASILRRTTALLEYLFGEYGDLWHRNGRVADPEIEIIIPVHHILIASSSL